MRRCWLYSILAWGLLCLGASEASARLGASRFFPGLYYPDAPQEADAQVIDVAENAGFDSADLSLSPAGGTLTGEVVGPDGPAVGLLVQAWVGTIRVDGRTDDSGRFSLEGVPAGSVLLRFSSDAPYSRDRAHAAAYLGGVDAPDQSPRIELADQESKDIGHQTLEWGAILGGRVMTPEGFGLEGARIRIEDGAGGFWSTETGPQGRWRQGGLAAGSYLVEVTPPSGPYLSEFFGGARTSDEAALVSATVPSERLDLDVDLDVGGEIDGRVRNETGSPYPDFEVEFEDRDRGTVFKTRTEDHGEYAMTGLPAGSYYVFVPRLNRYFPSAVHVEDARTVTVAEGAVAGRVDVIGFDLGDCRLSNDGRGVIHGVLDVDFAYTDAVVVTALSPSDTVETAFHDPGAYSLDCVPPGDYLVRFVAQGGYPRLFHPGVPDEAQAVRVTVAGDTAMAVDYLPDRSTWIAGRVLDAESNTPIGAVRVSARSTNGRVVASALTEADGFYRIETLPDGSGLPAGSYRVLAESTLVPDPDVTPVLQPTVSARQDGDQIRIAVGLAELGSWRVRVWRSTDPEEPGELVLDRMVSGAVGSVEILDRPPTSGTYRYALQADLLLDTGPEPLRAWSDPVAFARLVRVQVWAYPDPWSGVGAVRLRRSVSSERMQLAIISASGRRVASLDWPTNEVERVWNGTDSRGRPVPSGVYYLGLRDGTGRLLDGTTVVIGR